MRRYMFLGDTHGDLQFAARAIAQARRECVDEIIQVGDWAFLWPNDPARNGLNALSTVLIANNNITMRFIDGNHDWHPELAKARGAGAEPVEHALAPNIIYQPRGSRYTDADGTRFLFVGGAPSIDRELREEHGWPWWAEEVITDQDVDAAIAQGPCDVLVTHDSPILPPDISRDVGSPRFRALAQRSQEQLYKVVRHTTPKLIVHGHYHRRYTGALLGATVVGLAHNHISYAESAWLIWSRS